MITVIVPTYNRYDCMKEILLNYICKYSGTLFRFEIHDSSESDCIESICKKIIEDNSTINLNYYKYSKYTSPDKKIVKAISNVNSEYFYLCGDGYVVDFSLLEEVLLKGKYNEYQVIDIERTERKGILGFDHNYQDNIIYEYSDEHEYSRKYYSHLTSWGSEIINTVFFNKFLVRESRGENQHLSSFWVAKGIMWAIDAYINEHSCVKLGVLYCPAISLSKFKIDHSWTAGDKFFSIAIVNFNETVDLLPSRFNPDKNEIIKIFRSDSLFLRSHLLRLRQNGTLNFKSLHKYRKEIERNPGDYRKFLMFCCIPKFLISIYYVYNQRK